MNNVEEEKYMVLVDDFYCQTFAFFSSFEDAESFAYSEAMKVFGNKEFQKHTTNNGFTLTCKGYIDAIHCDVISTDELHYQWEI